MDTSIKSNNKFGGRNMKIDIKKIERIEWIKTVTRPMFLYGQITQTEAERDLLREKIGFGFRNKILFPAEGGHTQYFGKEDWINFTLAIKRKLEQKSDWLKTYAMEVYDLGEKITKFVEELSQADFSVKSNDELVEYYHEFKKHRGLLAYLLYPHLVIERILEEKLKEELRKELEKKRTQSLFEKYLAVITTKIKPNESDEANEELLRIAIKFKKERKWNREMKDMLEEYSEKYAWLPYYGYGLPIGNKEYFRRQLLQIEKPEEKLDKKIKEREYQKEALKKVKEEFKGSPVGELIEIIQTYLHLRAYRTEVLRKAYYYPRILLEEIARRIKMDLDDIFFFLPKEIEDSITKGTINLEEIRQRKKHYAIVMIDGKIDVISKEKELEILREILRKILFEEKEETTLRGEGIYPGKIRGVVRIVRDVKEIPKVKRGDILVTTMTTPEMHIAIEKASAIITDEGGITSHAAVISRELKIPCVIATEIATKVLKDGDIVEIDSKEGIVRRLKNGHEKK